MGSPASANDVVTISPRLWRTLPSLNQMSETAWTTSFTCGSLNGISCLTHWSYTSGPCMRSIQSSIQSVNAQPVASPDSTPMHHGVLPAARIVSCSAMNSSQLVGTLQPFSSKELGLYQT